MYAQFTNTKFIFIVSIACFLVFSALEFARSEVESQGKSALTVSRRSQLQILQVGEFLCEIAAEPNDVWLGLYPTKDGYSLMPSAIRVEAFYDPMIDDDENVSGATRVSVHGQNAPLFLVTGLDSLRTGRVKTLFSGRLPLLPGSSLEITLDNERNYAITVFGDMTSNSGATDRNIKLVKGNRSQAIYTVDTTNATVPYLLWAGDLDRDGELDLLIDTVRDYNASGAALFLSSLAEDGNLLKKAAQFNTTPM